VKGRSSKGNIATKFPVKRVELKERGESTLEARKVWFDETVQRLNSDERGRLIGSFKGEDRILIAEKNGALKVVVPELTLHFDPDMIYLEKLEVDRPLSAVYYDGEKGRYFVKRFLWEGGDKEENIITAHPKSELVYLSNASLPRIEMVYRKQKGAEKDPEEVLLSEFISVKGIKAKGNQLTTDTLNKIVGLEPLDEPEVAVEELPDIAPAGPSVEEPEAEVQKTEPSTEPQESTAEVEKKTEIKESAPKSEPQKENKGSYNADDQAPQITLDF
jgi:topoisomerase-4 subunit A